MRDDLSDLRKKYFDANRRFREAEEAEQIAGHKLAEAVLRRTGELIDWKEEWQRFYEKKQSSKE